MGGGGGGRGKKGRERTFHVLGNSDGSFGVDRSDREILENRSVRNLVSLRCLLGVQLSW